MKSTKILIIEDEPVILESTRDLLVLNSYIVYTALNGQQGIELAEAHRPDLIICDIKMPVMDGYTLLERVRKNENLNLVPFIFTSAKVKRDDIRRGMDLGADDYLTKPYKSTELLNSIEARLKRRPEAEVDTLPAQNDTVLIDKLKKLTKAEKNILLKVMEGHENTDIAENLFISRKTVENHRAHIVEKLQLSGNNALLRFATKYSTLIKKYCLA